MDAQTFSDQAADHFNGKAPGIFIPKAVNANDTGANTVEFLYDSMEEAFPEADPGHEPMGNLVIVQIRQAKHRTKGGVIIETESRKTEQDNTQVAKVISLGPLAFRSRETQQLWPEGAWAKPGDFVRIPKYQKDCIVVPILVQDFDINPRTGARREFTASDTTIFAFIKDLHLIGKITCNPLTIRTYLGI